MWCSPAVSGTRRAQARGLIIFSLKVISICEGDPCEGDRGLPGHPRVIYLNERCGVSPQRAPAVPWPHVVSCADLTGPLTTEQVTFALPLVVKERNRLKLKTRSGAVAPLHSDEVGPRVMFAGRGVG